jgi:beta-mannanase
VTNAEYAWTVAESNFFVAPTDRRYAPGYYPGDAYVDDIAVDAYNMYCLRKDGHYQKPWMSLEQVLAPLMTFAAAHPGPGLMMAEFGSPEDANMAGRKAQWFADAEQLLQQPAYARFKAALYWNQKSSNFVNCDFRVNTSASSLQAFSALANDPYYSATAS